MSQVKLDHPAGLAPMEAVLPDPGLAHTQSATSASFGDQFRQVRLQLNHATAGGELDFARLSQPSTAAADPTGRTVAERRSPADDRRRDRHDSADVDANDGVGARSSPEAVSPSDRRDSAPPEGSGDKRQASGTGETNSCTEAKQNTQADSDANQPDTTDPQKASGKHVAGRLKGQADLADLAFATSDQAQTDQPAAQQVTPEGLGQDTGLTLQDPAGAAGDVEVTVETSVDALPEQPDAVGHDRLPTQENPTQEAPAQQPSQGQVAQVATPLPDDLPTGKTETTDRQDRGHTQHQTSHVAAAAAISQAATQTVSSQLAASDDEPANTAADHSAHAVEGAARPATIPAADARLQAPLRIAPSEDPRADSPQRPQAGGETLQVDRARFVQRVARAFGAVSRRDASVRLRLSPPELGSLRLEVSVRGGLMTARVEAETTSARTLLLDNLPALRDRLAQQDIKIKQFDVHLTDQSLGGMPDRSAQHTDSHQRSHGDHAPQVRGNGDREAKPVSRSGAPNRPDEGSQLNVVI